MSARAAVHWDGLYHNNTNLDAQTEAVPAELTPGETNRFLEIDYSNNVVDVYLLTDSPAADGAVSCRVRFYTAQEGEEFEYATWQTNVTLTVASQFHATPTNGTNTLDLWKASWLPPNGFTGTVYYSPQVLEDGGGSDIQSLIRDSSGGGGPEWGVNDGFWQTNAQHIGDWSPAGVDFTFQWTNELPLNFDWFYFNNTNVSLPENELVPGLGSTNFFQYSYDPDIPGYVYTLSPKAGLTSARTRFWFGGGPGEIIRDAEWFTNVEITNTASFHGLPATGNVTMDVWRTAFYVPDGWGTGGSHTVYYATELTVPKNGTTWLAANFNNAGGADNVTNNWTNNPQFFTSLAPNDARDWNYTPTAAMARAESLERNWAYHNNTNLDARLELIPGMGVLHFLELDYTGTTTTFYALLDNPSIAKVPGETTRAQVRLYSAEKAIVEWLPVSWAANVSLDTLSQFHGLPSAGSKTLDLWKGEWQHPTNALGPVTNQFDVYYSFLLETLSGSGEYVSDQTYLTAETGAGDGWGTNSYTTYPQLFGPEGANYDYKYTHKWRDEGDDDGDGMPNWWEESYLGGKTNGNPAGNTDGDALDNLDEWIADTLPNDTGSVFDARITNFTENEGQVTINAGPRTSTRRVYDLWWKTNLMDAAWNPLSLNLPGNYDGSSVTLTASNTAQRLFYKSGVKMP